MGFSFSMFLYEQPFMDSRFDLDLILSASLFHPGSSSHQSPRWVNLQHEGCPNPNVDANIQHHLMKRTSLKTRNSKRKSYYHILYLDLRKFRTGNSSVALLPSFLWKRRTDASGVPGDEFGSAGDSSNSCLRRCMHYEILHFPCWNVSYQASR